MSRRTDGLQSGDGRGEHRSARDTERITYERARSVGMPRDRARSVAREVARDVHTRKE